MDSNSYFRKNLRLYFTNEGFTLIELIAVISILGTLASLGISNVSKWNKLSKADEAVSVLNNSLVECLQYSRNGTDPLTVSPPSDVISDERLVSTQYKIKDNKDKCSEFFIEPIDPNEKTLFEMGYQIDADGNVIKIGFPADNQASLSRCKRWAGSNCGATPEQIAEWERLRQLAEDKKNCFDELNFWLKETPPNGGTGPYEGAWDSASETCDRLIYAFEGTYVSGPEGVEAAREAKLGAECNEQVKEEKAKKTNGITFLDKCTDQTFYFCQGINKQTPEAMQLCKDDHEEEFCKSDISKAKQDGWTGKFPAPGGPGVCSQDYWFCGDYEYTKLAEYENSDCSGSDEEEEEEEGYSKGAKEYCLGEIEKEGILSLVAGDGPNPDPFCDHAVPNKMGWNNNWWGCKKYQKCLDKNRNR